MQNETASGRAFWSRFSILTPNLTPGRLPLVNSTPSFSKASLIAAKVSGLATDLPRSIRVNCVEMNLGLLAKVPHAPIEKAPRRSYLCGCHHIRL